ncbi:fimbrial protein [Ralstonia pickettii]|uniref:Fimbrial protein n=1 Tax=Ralstonia pickettii TaxID=329 RepID=A0A7X2LCH7_RALPI|nr:fimbrial protein [Ralstonia pickettii]MRT01092.1 fimbrial protein [Ralstonia pickettii]
MIVKGLIQRCIKTLRAGGLVIVGWTMLSGSAEAGGNFVVFSGAYALPSGLAKGTVVARRTYTPMQICNDVQCRLTTFKVQNSSGTENTTGTTGETRLSGLSMQVIVNGKPQRKLVYPDEIIFSTPVEVQLVRDAWNDISTSKAAQMVHVWFFTKTIGSTDSIISYFGIGDSTLTKIEGTCSVPSQAVQLPPTVVGQFRGNGSTAGFKAFQIKIDNCPKGYNRVGYTLEPMGGVSDSPGVLPLSADSTVQGVKIRVTDRDGVAAQFGTSIKVDDYNKATGGSYAIPMQASYVQTEAGITPGTVKGAVSVVLDYQ